MPLNDNDTYGVDQNNGIIDNDFNMNVGTASQVGFFNFGGAVQGISSGGNGQFNTSGISDTSGIDGWFNGNDYYSVDQDNELVDNDTNSNVGTLSQAGLFNFGGLTQGTTSGGNGQSNTSLIQDGGMGSGWFTGNDQFRVDQYNGLADNDENTQVGDITQMGGLNFAGASQIIGSGGNTQTNSTGIGDAAVSLGLFTGNDTYWTGQSNTMFDMDANANGSAITQIGDFNFAGVTQAISSGGNGQANVSSITDLGLGFGAFNDNDDYEVSQQSLLEDIDQNMNVGTIQQAGFGNLAGVGQGIVSGGNAQANASGIVDLGSGLGLGAGNDTFRVGQQNIMFDNDINTNVGVVAQIGFGNVAGIDQSILSGGNGQMNTSAISDVGFGGFGASNDTYTISQANMLADNDTNANGASISQAFAFNFADFGQDIVSGGNVQANTSTIDDA